MKPLEVLIIDDEPIARDILEEYVRRIPSLHLAGTCRNALEAQSMLATKDVQLLLIDINMPHISGIDFVRTLKHPPMVIFTTAYAEYAVQSYELDAIDYLLKPISFERFFMAIGKVVNQRREMPLPTAVDHAPQTSDGDVMFVKSGGKLIRVDLSKLWLVEALKDYMKLYVGTEKIIVYGTMKSMESQLSAMPAFLRISKSCIVHLHYITEIEGNAITVGDKQVVIGPTYKDRVTEVLNSYKML